MKMNRSNVLKLFRETGKCPAEFELKEVKCLDSDKHVSCNECWEHAIKDVKRIELEG